MRLSFDNLFIFNVVVDCGSFLGAAKLLKIGQSTVSRRVKELELSLGTDLIKRDTYNFELTDSGKQIYAITKDKDKEIKNNISNILNTSVQPKGVLKISIPPMVANIIIAPYLVEFSNNYPDIQLEICVQNKEVDLVKEGVDLLILGELPKQQGLKVKSLMESSVVLYCTPEYADIFGTPQTPEDLYNHTVMGLMLANYSIVKQIPAINIFTNETIMLETNGIKIFSNNNTFSYYVSLSNQAIGASPFFMVSEQLTNKSLIHVLPEWKLGSFKFYQIRHPKSNEHKLDVLVNFIKYCFDKHTI